MENNYKQQINAFGNEFWEIVVKRYPKAYWAFSLYLKNECKKYNSLFSNSEENYVAEFLNQYFLQKGIEIRATSFAHPLTGREFTRFDYYECKHPLLKGKVYSGIPILSQQYESLTFFKYLQAFELLEQKISFQEKNKLSHHLVKQLGRDNLVGIYHKLAQAS